MAIKSLHFTNAWHESSGGIATFYRALLAAANRRQRRISLVVPGSRDGLEEAGSYGRIYHVAAPRAPFNPEYRMLYPRQYLLPGSAIQRILQAERPDLVEICDKYGLNYLGPLLRLRLLKDLPWRPVVVGLSCERMDRNVAVYLHRPLWGDRVSAVYMRFLYFPFFDHHIAISPETAAELKRAAGGHPVERAVWIRPMGVDLSSFSPQKRSPEGRKELIAKAGATADSALLLYVGRLAPEKNLDVLLGMMESLGSGPLDYRLIVAGDGSERERLSAGAAARVPGKIAFLGHVNDREMLSRIYANSDLFIHPNPSEPFGIAPLEAMASGLPVLAPDSGGIKSYANGSNSYLVGNSPAAFAQGVRTAFASPSLRKGKASHARLTAEQFSWPRVTDSFLELYDAIYAVSTGKLPLREAAPAFCSTPADSVQSATTALLSRTAKAGFTLYSKLAARRARHRAAPGFVHP